MVFGIIKVIDDFFQTIAGVKPQGHDLAVMAAMEDPDYSVFNRNGRIEIEYHPERAFTRAWFNNQTTKKKNHIGRVMGFGSCHKCGGTWNWKKDRPISYSERSGMFPLCVECYEESTPQQRFDYCKDTWVTRWGRPENELNWNIVAKNVGLHQGAES